MSKEKSFVQGVQPNCCKDPGNLERQPSNKPELIINKCRVCGRNQYRLLAGEILKKAFGSK